ncbi:hypothetical protein IM697_23605 [Streptomyces ferrugineus]|uniref:Uncharacterized protein n=1 Tax=Streptomyces ferrugineus TaxID=1413221 RepID=A0A7M2SCW1_9ACTN|nr:hypothetical protein [Streptomyces ferrugineus]QOV33233.1 hypothetical protein IM697_23605 [Streptomyces ferrugineus]
MAPAAQTRAFVEHASALLVGEGVQTAEMTLEGSRNTLVFYRRDHLECERRRQQDAAPLGIGALTALLQLPADIPIPLHSLPEALQAKLPKLPRGAVTLTGDHVCRQAVRPLTVDLAVVRARSTHWEGGLARASRFRTFTRRALLVDPPAPARDDLLMRAAYLGIGILEPATDGLAWALLPEPYRPRRHTAVAWHFTEQLHARLP